MTTDILLVINGTDFGGTESALFDTACCLRHRGRSVRVLSLKPIGRVGRQLRSAGIPVETLNMPARVGPMALLSGCWRLAAYLRQRRPAVVHSFLPRANVMSRVAVKLAGLRTPHVSSERSTDMRRRTVISLLNRCTAPLSDRILAVSSEVRDVLVEREGIPQHRISILENGIDLDRVDAVPATDIRAELGLDPRQVILCSAGRLVHDKGHVYLIRAISRIRARDDVSLVIVGEGVEEPRLRAEAAAHGLSDRVHFLGYRSDLLGILKAIDVFVLPSLEEGVPVVVLEAMACGRPVVSTDVGGVRSLVTPAETGILVPPAEIWKLRRSGTDTAERDREKENEGVTRLAAALDELVASRSMIEAMGRQARRRVEEQFALSRVVARLERIYEGVAAHRGSARAVRRGHPTASAPSANSKHVPAPLP